MTPAPPREVWVQLFDDGNLGCACHAGEAVSSAQGFVMRKYVLARERRPVLAWVVRRPCPGVAAVGAWEYLQADGCGTWGALATAMRWQPSNRDFAEREAAYRKQGDTVVAIVRKAAP